MTGDQPELAPLFAELLDESERIADLDFSQRDAWVSGACATWRGEIEVVDPNAADEAFIAFCDATDTAVSRVLAAIARDLTQPNSTPSGVEVTGCWLVEDPTARDSSASGILGFRHRDGSEHSVLAEIDDRGRLTDIQLGPAAAEVLPSRSALAELGSNLMVHENDPAEAAIAIGDAWRLAHGDAQAAGFVPEPGLFLNQLVLRRRLQSLQGSAGWDLPLFVERRGAGVELHVGMTSEEVAEANGRSAATLARALGAARNVAPPPGADGELTAAAARVFEAAAPSLTQEEREGLAFLEWADWLGVILGAVRAGPGASVHGEAMVDWINRCPEVTSSVAKRDRPYVAWTLDVAARVWNSLGLVAEGELTELGWWTLPRAAAQAWGHDFDD